MLMVYLSASGIVWMFLNPVTTDILFCRAQQKASDTKKKESRVEEDLFGDSTDEDEGPGASPAAGDNSQENIH